MNVFVISIPNKKERVIRKFKVDFQKSFCWHSNLSNDNITYAYARPENGCGKMAIFWSETGSGFKELGGPPQILRNTPLPPARNHML